jgi:hypothetical protein
MRPLFGRAVGPRPMSGCGPGTRDTCSAVLSGVLAQSSRHTRRSILPPGYWGGGAGGHGGGLPHISWRVAVYFVGFRSSFGVGGERGSYTDL